MARQIKLDERSAGRALQRTPAAGYWPPDPLRATELANCGSLCRPTALALAQWGELAGPAAESHALAAIQLAARRCGGQLINRLVDRVRELRPSSE